MRGADRVKAQGLTGIRIIGKGKGPRQTSPGVLKGECFQVLVSGLVAAIETLAVMHRFVERHDL